MVTLKRLTRPLARPTYLLTGEEPVHPDGKRHPAGGGPGMVEVEVAATNFKVTSAKR